MSVVGVGATIRENFPTMDFTLSGRKYKCEWLVEVDSYLDGPVVVQSAAGLPLVWDTYAIGNDIDLFARLREFSVARLAPNSLFWVVSATYSTPEEKRGDTRGTGAGTNKDPSEITNPIAEIPTAKFGIVAREVPITRIYNYNSGKFNAVMNSACQIFNPPPMRRDIYLSLEISRNEPVSTLHPGLGVQYASAVNSDVWWGFRPGQVQCQSIIPEQQTRQLVTSQFVYLKVVYSFLMKYDGWQLQLLDAGDYCCETDDSNWCDDGEGVFYYCGSGSGPCASCDTKIGFLTKQGAPRKGLLDGHGGALPLNADPVYLDIRPYNSLFFAPLNLPQSWAGLN